MKMSDFRSKIDPKPPPIKKLEEKTLREKLVLVFML